MNGVLEWGRSEVIVMIRFKEDVRPVSDLRRHAHEIVGQARRTGRPVLITQRGRGAAVLLSIDEWERREEREELILAVLRGERDIEEGRIVDEEEAWARLEAAAAGRRKT
jgi:prevent-host-death family protein